MTDCPNVRMRELLPEYMHDSLEPVLRLAVSAHLSECEDCRDELALLRSCRQVMAAVPRIDSDRILRALPAAPIGGRRLQSTSARRTPGFLRGPAWRVAAAALLTVGAVGVAVTRGGNWLVADAPATVASARPGQSSVPLPASELTDGSQAPLLAVSGGLSDLSDAALETLLAEVGEVDGLPAVEPQPLLSLHIDSGDDPLAGGL